MPRRTDEDGREIPRGAAPLPRALSGGMVVFARGSGIYPDGCDLLIASFRHALYALAHGRLRFTRSSDSGVLVPGGMMGRGALIKNVRIFGVIKKIDGAVITVLDNGNTERAIVSTASTIIVDGDTELSVGDLKVGERIGVTGRSDDNILTAKLIEVIGL